MQPVLSTCICSGLSWTFRASMLPQDVHRNKLLYKIPVELSRSSSILSTECSADNTSSIASEVSVRTNSSRPESLFSKNARRLGRCDFRPISTIVLIDTHHAPPHQCRCPALPLVSQNTQQNTHCLIERPSPSTTFRGTTHGWKSWLCHGCCWNWSLGLCAAVHINTLHV